MGTSNYILRGTVLGMQQTCGSALHGAGRSQSPRQAARQFHSDELARSLRRQGIYVRTHGRRSLAEVAPAAYKDVDPVVSVMAGAGIVVRLARLSPLVCIKG